MLCFAMFGSAVLSWSGTISLGMPSVGSVNDRLGSLRCERPGMNPEERPANISRGEVVRTGEREATLASLLLQNAQHDNNSGHRCV